MANKKTLFISDLHLQASEPDTAQIFLQLLANPSPDMDAIYILGDLFEAWIGDDDETPFNNTIMHALHTATQKGLPIYFMCGNRDFLIGKKFAHATGCYLLPDEEKINLYGTPVLLMHGDTLCTRDLAYLKARRKLRTKWLQSLYLLLPLSFRRRLADMARTKSRKHTQNAALEIMDVTPSAVDQVMQKHEVNYLIHGHTHRPAIHNFLLNNTPAERIVLGAWHEQGNALVWDETGKKELISL